MKNHVLRYLCLLLMLLLCSIAVAETADMPTVFYSGNTVTHAGDIIGIRGEYLDQVWTATMTDGTNTASVELLQQNRQSFKFQVPENMGEGLLTLNLTGEKPLTIVFNEPKVKWMQGDEGPASTSNGWVRVQGECLSITEDANITLTLTATDGTAITLTPDRVYDDYSVGFVFNELANGEYQAVYSNGFAETDCGPLTIAPSPEESWGQKVYDVTKLGVKNDGHSDCTAMVNTLFSLLGYRGGGIVYFPEGRYMMTGSLTIPPNVTIRGDGPDETQIFWRDVWRNWTGLDSWVPMSLPNAMLHIESDVAIEDIEFSGGRMGTLFKVGSRTEPGKNIRIENVRVWQNSFAGVTSGAHPEIYNAITQELRHGTRGILLDINGSNIKIINCDFVWTGKPTLNGNSMDYFLMQNVVIDDTMGSGWWSNESQCAIVEDCEIVNRAVGFGGENIYMARMEIHDTTGGDHEVFTTDITAGIDYYGKVAISEDAMQYTFPDEVDMAKAKAGAKLLILRGKGAGQWRYITAVDGHTVTIAEPFAVAPDADSDLTVNYMFWNWYLIDVNAYDGGIFQFYVAQGNTVVDGLHTSRTPGVNIYGFRTYKAVQNNWYLSVINSTIENGNVYHNGGWYEINAHSNWRPSLPVHAFINVRGREYQEITMSCTLRNNTVKNDCMLYVRNDLDYGVADLILDSNHCEDTRMGIYVEGTPLRMYMYGNTFNDVETEYLETEPTSSWQKTW